MEEVTHSTSRSEKIFIGIALILFVIGGTFFMWNSQKYYSEREDAVCKEFANIVNIDLSPYGYTISAEAPEQSASECKIDYYVKEGNEKYRDIARSIVEKYRHLKTSLELNLISDIGLVNKEADEIRKTIGHPKQVLPIIQCSLVCRKLSQDSSIHGWQMKCEYRENSCTVLPTITNQEDYTPIEIVSEKIKEYELKEEQ